jgi:hypothetical protein
MGNAYTATITKRKYRKTVIRDLDRYDRLEITGGASGLKGEIYRLKGATALASTDTITLTVA